MGETFVSVVALGIPYMRRGQDVRPPIGRNTAWNHAASKDGLTVDSTLFAIRSGRGRFGARTAEGMEGEGALFFSSIPSPAVRR